MDLLSNVVSGKEIGKADVKFLRQKIGKPIKVMKKGRIVRTGWIHDIEKTSKGEIVFWISGKKFILSEPESIVLIF